MRRGKSSYGKYFEIEDSIVNFRHSGNSTELPSELFKWRSIGTWFLGDLNNISPDIMEICKGKVSNWLLLWTHLINI